MDFKQMVGIKRFNYNKSIYLLLICCFIISRAFSQTWSVPAKSGEMMFNSTVYLKSIYPGPTKDIKDTLAATGTLITDKGKIYIVTNKHVLVRTLFAKNQQLANDSIYINPSWEASVKGNQIRYLSGSALIKPAVVFSSDKEDLAVISLQRKQDKPILANLLKNKKRPIPLTFISLSNNHHAGDSFFHIRFLSLWDKQGKPKKMQGLGPGKIVSYNPKSPIFTIKNYYGRGSDGSSLFANNKLIGVVTGADDVKPSISITVEDAHPKEVNVTVVKASYILPLLKKLQQYEITEVLIKTGTNEKPKINATHHIMP